MSESPSPSSEEMKDENECDSVCAAVDQFDLVCLHCPTASLDEVCLEETNLRWTIDNSRCERVDNSLCDVIKPSALFEICSGDEDIKMERVNFSPVEEKNVVVLPKCWHLSFPPKKHQSCVTVHRQH